ncbi:MAG: acyltransferase [Clostridiales bacterium]|nr:acyltransferase [Roseburia sp.]MDD7635962.1 acyltransferase [Clostridiales bacterium]MDY4111746.1 acyltransferase [Roseburia sp.]
MNITFKEKLRYKLLGNAWSAERKIYIDYVRLLATVFVVCVHTLELARTQLAPGTIPFQIAEVFHFVFLSCNLLFIMVSGALLLPIKNERIGDFFVKRFSKVAIPFLVYYIIYVCAKEGIQCLYPNYWLTFLKRILIGPPVEAPHFWLIYVILWLYVLTPFLRYLVQNIPDEIFAGVIVVIFLVNALDTYLPLFGKDAHLSGVVDSYVGVFLLGYYMAERCCKRAENILIAGGIASFLITCYIFFNLGWYDDYVYNNAPTMMLFASALFLELKRLATHWEKKGLLLQFVSRYSFAILLIHWAVLHVVVKQVLKVNVMSGGVIGGCLLAIVLTLVISLVGGMVFDLLLIQPLQKLFGKCFSQKKKQVTLNTGK